MSPPDALSDLGDRAAAKVDAELAGVRARHPSSDGLRKLADWLDQHGQNVDNVSAHGWMRAATPEAFAALRRDFGGEIKGVNDSFPQLRAAFGEIEARVFFDKKAVFVRKVVEREEVVPPEAAA